MLRLSFERRAAQGDVPTQRDCGGSHALHFLSYQISTADRTHARTDPTHNELKHTTTRKTATHERTPDKPHVHTHTPHTHTPFLFTGHSQSAVISRSHPALTPPPSLRPAPPLPVKHKYRVLAPGGYFYSIIASDRSFSPTPSRVVHVAFCPVLLGRDCVR